MGATPLAPSGDPVVDFMRMPRLWLFLPALAFGACRFDYEILEDSSALPPGENGGGQGGAGSGLSGGATGIAGGTMSGGQGSLSGGAGGTGGTGAGTGTGGGTPLPSCDDWWNADYGERLRLLFDNSGREDLDNFVVLVVLEASSFDYSRTNAGGADLRFVDADHSTILNHHVEHWEPGARSYLWVQVPRIDANSSADHIWMYYGSGDAAAEQQAGTYETSFAGVWHLNEGSGTLADSTSNGIDCTWFGSGGDQAATGVIGGGISTTGDNNGASSAQGLLPSLANQTVTIWARPSASGGGDANQALFSAEILSGDYSGPGIHMFGPNARIATFVAGAYRYGSARLSLGQWNFVAMRGVAQASGGSVEMKVNDGTWEVVYAGDTTTIQAVAGSAVQIGDYDPSLATTDFKGDLDEVQISSVVRSDSWIQAQYLSEGDLGFVSFSSPQLCP